MSVSMSPVSIRTISFGFISSHVSLLLYFFVSGRADFTLFLMIYITGLISIFLSSFTNEVYENLKDYIVILAVGGTTFFTAVQLSEVFEGFMSIFKWAMSVAFWWGGLKSMEVVEASTIIKKNIIFGTINLVLNIITALGVINLGIA